MRTILVALFTVILVGGARLTACELNELAFSRAYRGDSTTEVNLDLNDYGVIHVDAQSETCAKAASDALYDKLNDSLRYTHAFQRWLDGYNVAHIFSAAQQIGYYGWATVDLDSVLDRVAARYAEGIDPEGACDKDNWNGCLDEESGAAAAYAWIGAYKYRRGASSTSVAEFTDKARAKIASSFNSVCIHNSATYTSGTPCNGTLQQLQDGTAEIISVNHGQQTIPYGFGLLTGIASALSGLEAAAEPESLTADQAMIARKLFEEAQMHVDSGGNYTDDCARPMSGQISWTAPCGEGIYHPYMYRLDTFFSRYVGDPPTLGTYRSDFFASSRFALGFGDNGFFSFGRYVAYYTYGYEWMAAPPKLMPFDLNNPIGYFEQISATGLAQGWACDNDMPTARIGVGFQVGSAAVDVPDAWAGDASESAINQVCGGGFAHRFWVQLPSWTKGQAVKAYGRDYTWFGFTELPCLQSPTCSW